LIEDGISMRSLLLLPARFLFSLVGIPWVCFTCVFFGFLYRFIAIPFVPSWMESVPRAWARATLAPLTRYEIRGLEHIPDAPCAIFSNHVSFMDIPLIQSLPRNLRFVAKRLFAKLPGFRAVLTARGDILVDKSSGGVRQDSRSMVRAIEVGCSGDTLVTWKDDDRKRVLVVYAEGTRSRDGRLKPFKTRNIARHVARAGLPVVPAAIEGTYKLWRPRTLFLDFARIRVTFLPPVTSEDPNELLSKAHARVAAVLGEGSGMTDEGSGFRVQGSGPGPEA